MHSEQWASKNYANDHCKCPPNSHVSVSKKENTYPDENIS